MARNVRREDPPYMQIAEDIRRQIRSGQLRDGDLVPSTRQLAREWGVSVPTAAKALTTLRSEGYVRGVAGTGTIVCAGSTTHLPGGDRLEAIARTGRIYPPNERAVIHSAELVAAPDAIADALGVAAGTEVIRRHRVTYRDDSPVSASTSWLPGDLAASAPRLLATERIIEGTSGYIEQETGRAVVRGLDQESARAATKQDADDLGVAARLPCGLRAQLVVRPRRRGHRIWRARLYPRPVVVSPVRDRRERRRLSGARALGQDPGPLRRWARSAPGRVRQDQRLRRGSADADPGQGQDSYPVVPVVVRPPGATSCRTTSSLPPTSRRSGRDGRSAAGGWR